MRNTERYENLDFSKKHGDFDAIYIALFLMLFMIVFIAGFLNEAAFYIIALFIAVEITFQKIIKKR